MSVYYVYKGVTYLDQPKGTRKCKTEKIEGNRYITCKRKLYLAHIVMISLICYMAFLVFNSKPEHIKYSRPSSIHSDGKVLGLNTINLADSTKPCKVSLLKDNQDIINPVVLQPGDTVLNVNLENNLDDGTYIVEYKVEILNSLLKKEETTQLMLVVEQGESVDEEQYE